MGSASGLEQTRRTEGKYYLIFDNWGLRPRETNIANKSTMGSASGLKRNRAELSRIEQNRAESSGLEALGGSSLLESARFRSGLLAARFRSSPLDSLGGSSWLEPSRFQVRTGLESSIPGVPRAESARVQVWTRLEPAREQHYVVRARFESRGRVKVIALGRIDFQSRGGTVGGRGLFLLSIHLCGGWYLPT